MGNFNKKNFVYCFLFLPIILFMLNHNMDVLFKENIDTYSKVFRAVRNPKLIINKLQDFLNGRVSEVNETIKDGRYTIKIFGVHFKEPTDTYIGVRVYDEDKAVCSFVLYGADNIGLNERVLEVSRRKENDKDVNIGYIAEEILSLLKDTSHLLISQFPKVFNKRTFDQIETRMGYAVFKKCYAELESQGRESRLEAFVKTVDEIKAISEYEIKPSYIANFLSGSYFNLGEFREFSVLYNIVKELPGGITAIKEKFQSYVYMPDYSVSQAIDRIIQNYFYEHNIKNLDYISALLFELNLVSVSDITRSKVLGESEDNNF